MTPPLWYEAPAFYFTNPHNAFGDGDDIPLLPGSVLFDCELEVAAVVGRAGADLTPEQAGKHIAGYLIMNDWTARDLQWHELPLGMGPGIQTTTETVCTRCAASCATPPAWRGSTRTPSTTASSAASAALIRFAHPRLRISEY